MDDEKNFLDPADNPLIPTADEPEPKPKEEDRSDLDYRVPMDVFGQLGAEGLTEQLGARFPGRQEIEIGGDMVLVQMADGTFTLKATGQRLEELDLAARLKIRDYLARKP